MRCSAYWKCSWVKAKFRLALPSPMWTSIFCFWHCDRINHLCMRQRRHASYPTRLLASGLVSSCQQYCAGGPPVQRLLLGDVADFVCRILFVMGIAASPHGAGFGDEPALSQARPGSTAPAQQCACLLATRFNPQSKTCSACPRCMRPASQHEQDAPQHALLMLGCSATVRRLCCLQSHAASSCRSSFSAMWPWSWCMFQAHTHRGG